MPLLSDRSEEDKKDHLNWIKVRNRIKQQFGKRPDLNAILLLIGINELGQVKEEWEKEEKQDLMHIAICKLFEKDGYYTFDFVDEDGWPHYKRNEKIPALKLRDQEKWLKKRIVEYFNDLEELF